MAQNKSYSAAIPGALERSYSNVKQSEESSKQQKEKSKGNVAKIANAVAADQILNSGKMTSSILDFINPASSVATSTVPVGTPVASAGGAEGGTILAGSNPSVTGTVAPMTPNPSFVNPEAGTPTFAVGEPSTAGYVAGAIRGYQGAKQFFTEDTWDKRRNEQLAWNAAMTAANVYTGGLAQLAEMAGNKILGKGAMREVQRLTAPLSFVFNLTAGGKGKDQFMRDKVREGFQKMGFVDSNFNVKLADGSTFNIGVDGKAKADYGVNPQTGKPMHAFDLDQANPIVKQLIPLVNPLVNVLTGGNKKLASDFTGYLVRAAMSNSGNDVQKAIGNIQSFYRQLNASPTSLNAALDKMVENKQIDQATAKIYKDDILRATSGMKWGDAQAGGIGGFSFKMPTIKPVTPPPPTYSVDATAGQQAYMNTMNKLGASNQSDAYSNFARNFNISSPALSGEKKDGNGR